MSKKGHTKRSLAIGGLLLAGASYVAGVLTAPKSGKETRKDLRKAASKAKTEAEKKLKTAHSELNKTIDALEGKTSKAKVKVDNELKKAIAQAQTVRQKTREILSAIHEGEAVDKDLDKALDDVKKALKHLKTFVKK